MLSPSTAEQSPVPHQPPGHVTNGQTNNKAPRKNAAAKGPAKQAAAKTPPKQPAPPLSAGQAIGDPPVKARKKRRSKAQLAAAQKLKDAKKLAAAGTSPAAPVTRAKPGASIPRATLANAVDAGRAAGGMPPWALEAMLQKAPPTGQKWPAKTFTRWLEAFVAVARFEYEIEEPIAITIPA